MWLLRGRIGAGRASEPWWRFVKKNPTAQSIVTEAAFEDDSRRATRTVSSSQSDQPLFDPQPRDSRSTSRLCGQEYGGYAAGGCEAPTASAFEPVLAHRRR